MPSAGQLLREIWRENQRGICIAVVQCVIHLVCIDVQDFELIGTRYQTIEQVIDALAARARGMYQSHGMRAAGVIEHQGE